MYSFGDIPDKLLDLYACMGPALDVDALHSVFHYYFLLGAPSVMGAKWMPEDARSPAHATGSHITVVVVCSKACCVNICL